MAGVGFILRKLSKQDNLIGSFQAYLFSALIATGPWLFTIFSLSMITLFAEKFVSIDVLNEFRRIIVYNFAFSLVITSPVFMIVTRYLADSIYESVDLPSKMK